MSVPTALREQLADARARGMAFHDAWRPAVRAALCEATHATEASDWAAVLTATRPAWEASWHGQATTRPVRALLALAEDPERDPIPEGYYTDRFCGQCGDLIPTSRKPPARYCSDDCKRAAEPRADAA